ncbi:MAG: metallophosphoesterase [Clostridia bacterium]|nr:metallophosphoesterase [Clostridia bacterium]
MKNTGKKIISVIITIIMLISVIPMNAAAADAVLDAVSPADTLNFGFVSDLHYYPKVLTGDYCDEFMTDAEASIGRNIYQAEAQLESALAAYAEHAKENGMKYLVVSGDLTANGEYLAHVELAKRLERFEKETGIQVIIVNGNHDIVKPEAETFENGVSEESKKLTPEEFLELYKNLGYDLAYSRFVPKEGHYANMLSYSVRIDGNRFIVMDTGVYSPDVTKNGEFGGETRGCLTDDCLEWVLNQIEEAKACGETVIGVSHHNFAYHSRAEYRILRGFVIDNFEKLGETLADAGMHYNLSGHIHQSDIAQLVTDNGETLTEICCPSLSSFPNYFREMSLSTDRNGVITMDTKSFDVDCVKPVEVNGYTYDVPFRKESTKVTFLGDEGFAAKASDFILQLLKKYSAEIKDEGGLVPFLKTMGVDLEEILKGFLGNGFRVQGRDIFTVDNILLFVNDLSDQIYANYLEDPEATADFLETEIEKLLSVQVSDLPSTRFLDEYGFGDAEKPGDFEDLLCCIYVYLYQGDYYYEDDPFVMDALDKLENGDTVFKLFDALLEIVADDILQGHILNDLEFHPKALFPEGSLANLVVGTIGSVVTLLLHGDISYLNISNKILGLVNGLGIIEYNSLWGIVEHYMDEYLTDTQLEGIGQTLAGIVRDFAEDDSFKLDSNATIVYNGPVAVEATRENYRLPTAVTVTLGEDSTARNLSWYTKYSVQGSDIEIVEKGDSFTGKDSAPDGITVTAETTETTRMYPGVDLGVIGIMNYEFPMNRHIVKVSGLEAGKTYFYRIGDASRNWWSQTGSFKTENGGDETSFIHIGDPQSQSAKQYDTFAALIAKAYEMYDSDFIIDTGDNVDHGDNFRQWQWFLDEASDTLMNTALMSAAGNHEEKGSFAIDKNFVYSNVPEQDVEEGIYFSFDYNNVHVAILNTNNLDKDDSLNDEQIEWLKDDMQSSNADWKFVAFHKAMYSNGSHYKDDDVCEIRDELCELMPQLGIDMVFQGHDHVYLRTDSMIDNEVESVTTSTATFNGMDYTVKENPVGTVYVISGCSGVKVYKQKDASLTDKYFPRAEVIEDVSYSVFSGVHIVGDTLYFDAYTFDTETGNTDRIDSFAISKDLSVQKGTGVPEPSKFAEFFSNLIEFLKPVFLKLLKLAMQLFGIEFFGLV